MSSQLAWAREKGREGGIEEEGGREEGREEGGRTDMFMLSQGLWSIKKQQSPLSNTYSPSFPQEIKLSRQ